MFSCISKQCTNKISKLFHSVCGHNFPLYFITLLGLEELTANGPVECIENKSTDRPIATKTRILTYIYDHSFTLLVSKYIYIYLYTNPLKSLAPCSLHKPILKTQSRSETFKPSKKH